MASNFEKFYSLLNDAQKTAADTMYWPLMVVAGPWTWKTQIIGVRTANIILNAGVNPENILITTFTEAWVVAIKERLLRFIWNDAYKVNVSTIHSLAQDVISTFPEKFLEYRANEAIDDVETLEILKWILDDLIDDEKIEFLTSSADKYYYLWTIKSKIWNLKQEWISLSKFRVAIEKQFTQYEEELSEIKPTLKKYEKTKESQEKHIAKLNELVLIFERYSEVLREKAVYDFSDMINFVLEKFRNDEDLRYYYAEKFQFIMIDEYQDTNNAQNEIIDLILSVSDDQKNIMVVWDDDQSIYRFQGANIENMLNFSTKYEDATVVVMDTNYRSGQSILDISSKLIESNEERLTKKIPWLSKELTAWNSIIKDITPKVFSPKTAEVEKDYVLEKINKAKSTLKLEEIAVIVRSNGEVEEWSKFLESNWIPVSSKKKTNILNSEYVNFILDYLALIENPYFNETKLVNIIRSEISWIDKIDALRLNKYIFDKNYKLRNKLKLFDVLVNEHTLDELEEEPEKPLTNREWIADFVDTVLNFKTKNTSKSYIDFVHHFLKETRILDYIEKNWTFDDIEDVYTLFNVIKKYNSFDKEFWTEKLIEKLDLYRSYNIAIPRQILKSSNSGVQIMTAHSSKWLEFDTVFIPGLFTWNWDNKRVRDLLKLPSTIVWEWISVSQGRVWEEDRRLFFVALTRAKQNLYLSYPKSSWNKLLLRSEFVTEIETDLLEDESYVDWDLENSVVNFLTQSLIKPSEAEFDYIAEFLKDYKLSPTDLNTFLNDPIEFLNRVVFKYPFTDNKYTIFGSVYHKVLENMLSKFKESWVMPWVEQVVEDFKNRISKEILSVDEEKELLEKWIEWLEWYVAQLIPREVVAMEYNFRPLNLDFEGIPISWRIDKIEKVWEKSIRITDFKTGRIRSENDILWKNRSWDKSYLRQLLFYKLLFDADSDLSSKYNLDELAVEFVAWKDWKYKTVVIDYDFEMLEELKEEISDSWEKITDINFWKEILLKNED